MSLREVLGVGLLVILLFCAACSEGTTVLLPGGNDGGGAVDPGDPPQVPTVAGEWLTTSTEVVDTCGWDPPFNPSPMRVEVAGDRAIVTFSDGAGSCEESVRDVNGGMVTLSRSDIVDAGCGIVQIQSNLAYEFDGSTVSGLATHHITQLSGACGNLPCTYQLAIAGSRCEGCWPGCAFSTTTRDSVAARFDALRRLSRP